MATTTANMAPMAGDAIADQMVTAGEMVMVQSNITDADGDTLTWSVMSDMDMYATATVDDMGMVTITGVAAGMATITVTATDMYDAMGTQEIAVTVESGMLMIPSNVRASHVGTQVSIMWDGGENAETFTVVMVTRKADGSWDIGNAVYDQNLRGSTHTVSMETRPAGMYVIGVSAGRQNDDGTWEFTDWAPGSLDYQP